MFTRAVRNDLDFYSTSKGVYQSVRDGELKLISITMDLTLEDVSYPFVLPRTLDVLNAFAKEYRATCGERLVVTSAARPRTEQPRNASPKSVHPTGMAIDFRRPTGPCLTWMRSKLMQLESQGVLEATEERRPVHFHVAVLQRGTYAPPSTAVASAAASRLAPTAPAATIVPSPSATITTGTAAGTLDLTPPPAASTPPAKPPLTTPAPTPVATATKPAASTDKPSRPSTYTVRRGDTLSEIARAHGLTLARLRSLNGLKGSSIRAGQKLKVR